MSARTQYNAFRRMPVPGQVAHRLQSLNIPVPTRGLILNENEAFMKPGGALVLDNWMPTMRGLKLRGGCIRWCQLPEATPVISAFPYVRGNVHKMFAGNAAKLYDISSDTPTLVKSGQGSGNYSSAQLANAGGDFLTVVNDFGDFPLQYNGTTWTTLSAGQINASGPYSGAVATGAGLVHVCKYRNRLFFIEANSMTAWYLPLNAVVGTMEPIPLSGAAAKGGKLLFCATWSIDAGDGIDDKLVFGTTEGELIIFTGSNPADAASWRQEGLYQIPKPMGKNATVSLGGDLLIATIEGIVPVSAALTKDGQQLELAMLTATIKNMWREHAIDKRDWAWTMCRWEEYGGMFVTWPGGELGKRMCAAVNTATVGWCRVVGWDATCFVRMRGDMFFGTQDGIIMQADRSGYDDGAPYVCTLVGGWEMFGAAANNVEWQQARVSFSSGNNEPFLPQVTACSDYIIRVPSPPPAGPDPGVEDLWDQGLWDEALWDAAPSTARPPVRNTGWISIGVTGYSHAPVIQVTVGQQAKPRVEIVSISASYKTLGVNV